MRLAIAQIDDGLEVGNETPFGNRGPELGLELDVLVGIPVECSVVGHGAAARVLLGVPQGEIGLANELLVGRRVERIDGAADAGADLQVHAVEAHGLQQRVDDLAAKIAPAFVVAAEGQHGDELVAAVAGLHARGRQRLGQPVGHLFQNQVADEMPALVVDRLEAIEVDHEYGELAVLLLGLRQRLLELSEQCASVGKPRQRVVHRQPADGTFGAHEGGLRTRQAHVEPVPQRVGAEPAQNEHERQRDLGAMLQIQQLAA